MAGISRYEKAVLGATAAFLLFAGGWFLSERNRSEPYQVTTTQNVWEEAPPEQSAPEGDSRPESLLEGETINLNTASVYDLQRLPGIGEKRARAIVDYREEHGPFRTVDDLDAVDGIGQGILDGLREYATVG